MKNVLIVRATVLWHVVKNILGMNPLLVHYNSEFNTKIGIRNLANLATVFDCDMVTSTIAPSLLKRITRASLKKYGNMYGHIKTKEKILDYLKKLLK